MKKVKKTVSAILFAILLLALCVMCFNMRRYGAALFNAVWAAMFLICCREFSMDQYILTQLLLCLMVVMVNAGYWLANYKSAENGKWKLERCPRPEDRHLERNENAVNEKVLMICLIVAYAILAWYAIRTLLVFGFDLVEIRAYSNTANNDSVFGSQVDTVLFYGVATILVYTVFLVLAYSFSQNIKIKMKYYVLTLVAVLLQMITTGGGRGIVVRGALFFAAAAVIRFPPDRSLNIDKKKLVTFLGIGVGLLLLLEIVTLIRNEGEQSFVGQAIEYARGSVGHMQYRLTRPMEHQYYGGFLAFGGFFYYPIKLLNLLFGTEFQTSNDILAYLQEYRQITLYDQKVNYNAMVPNAFYFFRDNGYVGVAALSAFQGILLERAERNIRKPTFLRFVMWATCIYMIAYSPVDGILWAFRHPMTIIYCIILNRYLYKPTKRFRWRKHGPIDHSDCSNLQS